jgi:uncharacterized membrane protein
MDIITLILLIAALVCFVLSAFSVASPRVNLLALGLAFWVGAVLATNPVLLNGR